MKKLLMATLIIGLSTAACKKDEDDKDPNEEASNKITGTWNGDEITYDFYVSGSLVGSDTSDISDMAATFSSDGSYSIDSASTESESGTWKVISDGNRLVMTEVPGTGSDTMEIYVLNSTTFVFGSDYTDFGFDIEERIRVVK